MEFCDKCGSYMKKTEDRFVCQKCGKVTKAITEKQLGEKRKIEHSNSIYVVDSSPDKSAKVTQVCPNCGNEEALRWFSRVSGEHAGVRTERTIEHFKCTKCSHMWSKTS